MSVPGDVKAHHLLLCCAISQYAPQPSRAVGHSVSSRLPICSNLQKESPKQRAASDTSLVSETSSNRIRVILQAATGLGRLKRGIR